MRRPEPAVTGPERATFQDVDALNRLFSDAFTDRYHRDGLGGVRVPFLSREVWRYAIEDAGEGAMLWRDAEGQLAGFNMVHASGTEGWMGPLAVRPPLQGLGVGRRIVRAGIEWLRRRGATGIGLETMPRTVENIGFYGSLGFRPGHLTLTLVSNPVRADEDASGERFSHPGRPATEALEAMRQLSGRLQAGVDYTREVVLTRDLQMGDTTLVWERERLRAFAIWHNVSLAMTRGGEELRVLKLVAEDLAAARQVLAAVAVEAGRMGVGRLAVRCQTAYPDLYSALLARGFRVQWTDLRMFLDRTPERTEEGIVLSNWEI